MATEISTSTHRSSQELTEEPPAVSNIFLSELLNLFTWNEPVGIYSSNNIPPQLKTEEKFTIICNLSRVEQPGTHFVSIIKRGSCILYLDPLASYLDFNGDLSRFIESCECSNIMRLEKPIQHINSWLCGYFCAFFSLLYSKNVNGVRLERFVEDDIKKNDCICIRNIAQIIENKITI